MVARLCESVREKQNGVACEVVNGSWGWGYAVRWATMELALAEEGCWAPCWGCERCSASGDQGESSDTAVAGSEARRPVVRAGECCWESDAASA